MLGLVGLVLIAVVSGGAAAVLARAPRLAFPGSAVALLSAFAGPLLALRLDLGLEPAPAAILASALGAAVSVALLKLSLRRS